ncbi:MAG: NUDIX hydrolase [Rhabdochlamydiaceae bacterium]|nr:NUDIX hydrolase [Candidatus Amphrikana amoebophyrae]
MPFSSQSVSVCIYDETRKMILLVKRRDVPVWVLPGGGIDPGETPEVAAKREAEEETGYKVTLVRKIGEYTPINKLAKFTHSYECAIDSGEPQINDEIREIEFFPISNLPYHMPPPYSDWIKDGIKKSKLIQKKITSVNYLAFIKFLFKHPFLVGRFILARMGLAINTGAKK